MRRGQPNSQTSGQPIWIKDASVLLITMLALTLGGCHLGSVGDGQRSKQEDQQRMDSVAAEVRASLTNRSDTNQVEVDYVNDITAPGTADASIQVTAGAAFEPVIDDALRLIWLSDLNPLSHIRIALVDAADNQRGEIRHFDADGKDKAALETRFGKRPG